MPISMQLYWSTDMRVYHRKCWQRSMAKSTARNKWKWSTSWRSGVNLRVHVRLAMPLISLHVYLISGVVVARWGKCTYTMWWWLHTATQIQPQREFFLSICHPSWVSCTRMWICRVQVCRKHQTAVASLSSVPKTTPGTIAGKLSEADRCVHTDDGRQSKCNCVVGMERRKY